ncbi:galactoside O-acetyltransferase [Secundilactobacillus paracollinoides]|uniref:galactoside O-acetyltransferase n=2 Tax=Secundilactobacillus paracollinoides TaxID=240427 RepID=UPI0006D0C504|nr:galactoside O-acetyltransferase [Secundilactobacillus paracollinoides]ANZ63590.1 galactoside O-acetyltransferase [Secundilactobacillus paracollinoides]
MTDRIIDMKQNTEADRQKFVADQQLIFKYNHTMPMTEDADALLKQIFQDRIGTDSSVAVPVQIVRPENIVIGNHVTINFNALFMAAGGIEIGDNVQIAGNVQLVSNNHDLKDRSILIGKKITIKAGVWIGAGASILPGVTVGENAVVGTAAVVTKDVAPNTVVAGNPARVIKTIQ